MAIVFFLLCGEKVASTVDVWYKKMCKNKS